MLWKKIKNIVREAGGGKAWTERQGDDGRVEKGIIVFAHTSEVIRAESLLKEAGLKIAVKGPPPDLRTGCDLVIEFALILQLRIKAILDGAGISPIEILPLQDLLLEPVSLFHVKDFGRYLMVRAANMKMTIDKNDLQIVNISGGGCPDVPYLAESLIGKGLHEAPAPRSLGYTLCGYALQLAYEELLQRCPG
ncbi:MAG TPA: DUF3343 domain-containing protein [Syntrophobacteraceae bacterium]|jgi:hypothetical protein|nr:DUF3343 domain-containing protein [Syntrophobacteraceae bacterium]